MLFWIIIVVAAALVALSLLAPLWRHGPLRSGASDLTVYRAQLSEIDRDLARGVLEQAEADRTRTEIARRILEADKAGPALQGDAPPRATLAVTLAGAVLVAGAGLGGYAMIGAPGYPDLPLAGRIAAGDAMRDNRPSQAEAEALAAALPRPQVDAPAEYLDAVAQLRRIVPTRPDDLTGWQLLVEHEAALGNYAAAAAAQAHVVGLRDDAVSLTELELLADLMVAAAAGQVSPEAESVLRGLLARDEANAAGRYYFGLLYAQTDRPDIAFRLWRAVIEEAGDTSYGELARGQIDIVSLRAGVDYTPPPLDGPTAADMEAAAEMSPEDREAMIRGMVAGLSDRLATEGGPASDWARLIAAYGVLGDTDQAQAIWTEAQQVFGAAPEELETIAEAARGAGLTE